MNVSIYMYVLKYTDVCVGSAVWVSAKHWQADYTQWPIAGEIQCQYFKSTVTSIKQVKVTTHKHCYQHWESMTTTKH